MKIEGGGGEMIDQGTHAYLDYILDIVPVPILAEDMNCTSLVGQISGLEVIDQRHPHNPQPGLFTTH